MFIYGIDIPLDGVTPEEAPPARFAPVEPPAFPFEYGKPIFPEDDDEA